jgi:hypothetical protein
MKLQSVRIKTNDFPEDQKELADTLGGILNPFIDKLVIGFNKNFTVDDNLPFEFKSLDIEVDVLGVPIKNNTLTTNLKNIKGYICINVIDINNTNTYPTATPFLSTEISGNTINIRHISGLPSGATYRLVLLGIS